MNTTNTTRRCFIRTTATGILVANGPTMRTGFAAESANQGSWLHGRNLRQVQAGVLDVGYFELGRENDPAVILLHGFPYSVDSFSKVAPDLAQRGCRVIVPYLRGHGSTRFIDSNTPRSGQQGAIGTDLLALMEALKLRRAVWAGYDWGGRAACVAAALWPERCDGLVSVNSYLIQDIASAGRPVAPSVESGIWYQHYFLTERGRLGLESNRREIARTIWTRNSPHWHFDDATLDRHVAAFDNPDYVDVVIHSYRHRLGAASGYPAYLEVEGRLSALPAIRVPTITLDGSADGVVPANDGKASAAKFSGPRVHRVIEGAGHNLPEEAPEAFADAVWELSRAARRRPGQN
ncbi:alpha/beta hydrolase [Variovorax sp. J31P207]|uniref:alpha/beta fold hydrolase n=1 Tax=Variovorax sp. J31P207 TaxID=3053510 RepID=UPI002576854B|nr:alpha/beta hydrolase [Variovorax sp. J31P207]MDM0066758.1 alpha/beta hydrolase [Variovorax sp. J31P207]